MSNVTETSKPSLALLLQKGLERRLEARLTCNKIRPHQTATKSSCGKALA